MSAWLIAKITQQSLMWKRENRTDRVMVDVFVDQLVTRSKAACEVVCMVLSCLLMGAQMGGGSGGSRAITNSFGICEEL
jgi:hypothetical protein